MAYAQAHRLPLPSEAASSSRNRIEEINISFIVDQQKLGSSFEAYKLVQDDPSTSWARSYGLPSRPPRLVDLYQPQGESRKEGSLTFTGLGYKETKERALHQVLVPSAGCRTADEPFAAYIDENCFLVVLTYDAAKDKVVGHPVHRLDQGAIPSGSKFVEPLPSLASISSTEWLASSGGTLKLIKLQKVTLGKNAAVRWIGEVKARRKVPLGEDAVSGAAIKACKKVGGKIRVLVQRPKTVSTLEKAKEGMQGLGFHRDAQQQTEGSKEGRSEHSKTTFEVRLVEIDEDEATGQDSAEIIKTAKLLWTVQGEEPLLMAKLGEQVSILGAEAPFSSVEATPSDSAISSQPGIGEASSSLISTPHANVASRGRRRAPHFSWAQTGDTVTTAFTLPSWITKSHIRAHFSLSALSLSFTQEALTLLSTAASGAKIAEIDADAVNAAEEADDDLGNAARMIASGRYVSRSTWAEIDPTGSTWTLERTRGMSLLTLYLEKRHEGTRWMQVFADRTGTLASGRNRNYADAGTGDKSRTKLSFQQSRSEFERIATGNALESKDDEDGEEEEDDAEDNEDDVPETMDPSELISMLEGMQKYTVDEESAQQGNGYGMDRSGFESSSGHGQNGGTSLSLDQPSLLKDSLEEEDANVGRNFVVSSISHASGNKAQVRSSKDGEVTILATSLPGANLDNQFVVVKHDLDGPIFASSGEEWQHVATMPALAFVLASKRDAQRVHIHKRHGSREQEGDYVVLAFESAPQVTGSGGSSGSNNAAAGAGNLFLYYSPSSADAKQAQSRVVRLGATVSTNMTDSCMAEKEERSASGALLGVCSAHLPRSGTQSEEAIEEVLVCLCENRILLLRGLL
ncbi:uncharacterized protein UTRI_00656 [Ustilago trichophora]|uniref:NudC domain-containing protein 1 n=1 Tax=Ustilago trichophora TaxID=86804 RepID=A0A5C3DVX3_9BASI|nr:uncharacterized protein UTRI_00656 [Ustilago trichophora]